MHLLILIGLLTVMYLVFPKGFKYMVASWVGAAGGIFTWGLVTTTIFLTGGSPSWVSMGWTSLSSLVAGVVVACIVAARD